MLTMLAAKQTVLPMEYERQKQELLEEKQRFEQTRRDHEKRMEDLTRGIPKVSDIIPLNEPIKKVSEELQKQGLQTQQSVVLLQGMSDVVDQTRGDQRKMLGELARLVASVEQRHAQEMNAMRQQLSHLEETKADAERVTRRAQSLQFAAREEISERKILAREYSALSGELAAMYLATLEDKSFFKRLGGLIVLPADAAKDVLTLNLWDSRKKEEAAKVIERRLKELLEKDDAIGRKYRDY